MKDSQLKSYDLPIPVPSTARGETLPKPAADGARVDAAALGGFNIRLNLHAVQRNKFTAAPKTPPTRAIPAVARRHERFGLRPTHARQAPPKRIPTDNAADCMIAAPTCEACFVSNITISHQTRFCLQDLNAESVVCYAIGKLWQFPIRTKSCVMIPAW